jgi:hypothetical protein
VISVFRPLDLVSRLQAVVDIRRQDQASLIAETGLGSSTYLVGLALVATAQDSRNESSVGHERHRQ